MEKRCSECPEPRLAQSLCTFCNKWLCYQCTDMHQHQRGTSQCPDLHPHPTRPMPAPQCPDLHPHPTRPMPAPQCPGPDLHQRGPSSQPPPDPGEHHSPPGSGSCPRSLLMCPSHRQEPLELFCESCDLLCCSSCHLSSHKNHRLVHVGKALQDQQWLFESLMAQVEERRAAVENSAKQIEDRLHSVKITQRKAENQIKMAKMIMMNELNKRANLLIEQLEKVSEDFQRRLEDQLQGAIEMCGQLDHVQNFVTWATAHHRRNPLLFSRELISLQMQRLLEPTHHPDAWVPVKIKFNWDASYWTKQMSSLGQLSVEGGSHSYSEGVACPSILRPQPITCMALPPVCRSGRDQGCAYQACYQPQMCCLHCLPPQPALQPEKPQREAGLYPARCAQSTLSSPPLLQRCWGPDSPPSMPPSSLQCPPPSAASPPSTAEPAAQLSSRNVSPAPSPSTVPQSDSPQPLTEHPPDRQAHTRVQTQPKTQASAEGTREVQAEKASRGELHSLPAGGDRELMVEENQEESREPAAGLPGLGRELGDQTPPERQQAGLQEPRPPQQPRDYRTHLERDGRRSTSLEMSVLMAHGSGDNMQSRPGSSPSPGPSLGPSPGPSLSPSLSLVCGKRKIRSQSTPADLSGRSSTLSTDRPPGSTHGPRTSTADRARLSDQFGYGDPRPSRVSDGVIRSVGKETGRAPPLSRGQPPLRLSPLTSYKTEPDNVYAYANEETGYEIKEKYRISRRSLDSRSEQEAPRDSGSPKVPVVCLERLKVLVSRLPPQGRRQSDPLPASGMDSSGPALAPRAWRERLAQGMSKRGPMRANLSLLTPPYTQNHTPSQPLTPPATAASRDAGRRSPTHEHPSTLSTDPEPSPPLCPSPDLDTDSDPRSVSEIEADSEPDAESDPQPESSSEANQESVAGEDLEAAGGSEADGDSEGAGGSGPSGESEPVEMGEELDADVETDADAESDLQLDPDPGLQSDPRPETDSEDMESDLPPESQSSREGGPDLESQSSREGGPDLESQSSAEGGPDLESQSSREGGPDLESQSSAEGGPDLESQSSREGGPDLESQSSAEGGPDLESDPDSSTADPVPLGSGPARKSPICPGQRAQGSDPGSEGAGEALPGADPEEMESEDFCAVCLIGGDLLCCDRCPKVFHLTCHVPSLLSFPTGDWMCTLCRDIQQPEVEYDCENQRLSGEQTGKAGQQHGLKASDQRKCERLTLLIFSNILSAPFHEPVSPLARHYYQIIKRPMDLSVIRAKLSKGNTRHYYSPEEFVADVTLMFRNCAKFNYPDSEVAQAGRSLESFFSSKLREVYPDRAFPVAEEDSDSDEYDEVARSADGGFPWPEKREQGHRKRKRRHSLNWRRHHF
ncbi:tripartite motif-containing protein 66 isoform X2 [Hypomesus transpacificus]|uniref:tripartite motif-containing protein 66 isoform X2 n=1 Tax=Hypomesus transpacificus TaxID=137520 RepID=UPI001F080D3A|nr:tripartite motif-containing protein 66 isoform X2 [Hypomesus transpacificus]